MVSLNAALPSCRAVRTFLARSHSAAGLMAPDSSPPIMRKSSMMPLRCSGGIVAHSSTGTPMSAGGVFRWISVWTPSAGALAGGALGSSVTPVSADADSISAAIRSSSIASLMAFRRSVSVMRSQSACASRSVMPGGTVFDRTVSREPPLSYDILPRRPTDDRVLMIAFSTSWGRLPCASAISSASSSRATPRPCT